MAGEFISGATPLFGVTLAWAVGACASACGVDTLVSSTFSFFFFPEVAIKIIRAIINNNIPPVINNPGIVKSQSKIISIYIDSLYFYSNIMITKNICNCKHFIYWTYFDTVNSVQ